MHLTIADYRAACSHFSTDMEATITNVSLEVTTTELAALIDDADAFVQAARSALSRLQSLNKAELQQLVIKCADAERKITEVLTDQAGMVEEQKRVSLEISDLSIRVSTLDSHISSLDKKIGPLLETIRRANEEIADNERRQSNAVYDLIPLHGIFSAIISGDAKRAIPYYSQVDGIISAIVNDKAKAEHELHRANAEMNEWIKEKTAAEQSICRARVELDNVERKLGEVGDTIFVCERLSATMSQRLSASKVAGFKLKSLAKQYWFLDLKIDEASTEPIRSMMQDCLDDFQSLRLLQA